MTREPHKPAGATGAFCADGALVPGATAAAAGLAARRVPTPGIHPAFVAGLAGLAP
jgi:hypothetical protein